jgi:hypothetical protein
MEVPERREGEVHAAYQVRRAKERVHIINPSYYLEAPGTVGQSEA